MTATPRFKLRLQEILASPKAAASRLQLIPLIYLLCVVLPVGFNLGPLYLTTLRLLLIVLIAPLFLRLLVGKFGQIILTDVLFMVYVFWMVLALVVNSPDQMLTQVGSVGVEFLGGYLVGRAYIRNRSDFIALSRWLVFLVLCLTPFAVHETLTGRPLIVEALQRVPGIRTVEIVTIEGRLGLERVQSSFAHPIHFGLFCSVTFSLCFVALKGVYSTFQRFLSSGVILLSGFLALSSGALLAILLQIFLISWSLLFSRVRSQWWLLMGFFVLTYIVIDLLSNRSPIRVFMSYATFSTHNAFWRGLIFDWGVRNIFGDEDSNIPAALWFGIGMNDWIRPSFMYSNSMDNFWLIVGVRYGIPAFLMLTIGYGLIISYVMKRDFSSDLEMRLIRQAWVFTFLGLTFTLCTVHIWTNIYSFVFFVFGAGVWMITELPRQQNEGTLDTKQDGTILVMDTPLLQMKQGNSPYSRFPRSRRR